MPGFPDPQTAFKTSGTAILITLIGGTGIFLLTTLGFSIIHRFNWFPRTYSPRWYLHPNRTPMISDRHPRFLFSWVKEIYAIPEDEILRTVGLDALVFLRTQRLYALLFFMCTIFGVGVLLPLNVKYGNPATSNYSKFAITTMASLPSRNHIENIHVYRTNIAATWLFTAFTVGLLWLEYRSYIALRFKWLTLPRTHNYSVMVTHIPPKMRNVAVLKAFFDRLLAPHGPQLGESIGKVLSVTLTMNLSRLEALVNERANVYRKLDHTMAMYALPDDRWCTSLFRRDRAAWRQDLLHDIRLLSERLQILNEVVECAQQEVRRLYYGYNDPSNFGLLDIEVVPSNMLGGGGGAGASGGRGSRDMTQNKESEASNEEEGISSLGPLALSPPVTPKSEGILPRRGAADRDDSIAGRPVSLPVNASRVRPPSITTPPPLLSPPLISPPPPTITELPMLHTDTHTHMGNGRMLTSTPPPPPPPPPLLVTSPSAGPSAHELRQQRMTVPEDEDEGKANFDIDGIDLQGGPFQLEPSGGPVRRTPTQTHILGVDVEGGWGAGGGGNGSDGVGGGRRSEDEDDLGLAGLGIDLPRKGGREKEKEREREGRRRSSRRERDRVPVGVGVRVSAPGATVVVGGGGRGDRELTEEARLATRNHVKEYGDGVGGGGRDGDGGVGVGIAGVGGQGGGEYGSFSPSTLPCDDRRPQISARSKAVLEQFFRKPISTDVYGTAFVTVSTLEATAILRQTVTYQRAFEIIVEEAPLPEDILWTNIDINFVTSYLRTALGHLLTLAITIAFFFPTVFISALNSVQTLKQKFPSLSHWLPNSETDNRWLNAMLAIIAPGLLLILLSIITPIFGVLTRRVIKDSRTISESHYHVYKRYFGFLFYNALIVFVVTESVFDAIKRAYSNPVEVLNQIGATLPKPAGFFINFTMIKALTGLPSELIRVMSYLQHLVKIVFVDELTEQNRAKVVIGCRSLTHPGGFHYGKFLAEHTLLYVYSMCYSCLAPLILPAGFAFFAGSYLVYKRQLLFVYEPEYETGGKMFKLILRYTFTGLFVAQFVMFVMLVTKLAYEDIPFFLPLPIATYFAKDLIIKWYGRLENHVPLSLAVAKDVRFWRGPGKVPSSRTGEILDLAKDTYHHPAVRAGWCEMTQSVPSGSFDIMMLNGLNGRMGGGGGGGVGGGGGGGTTPVYEKIDDSLPGAGVGGEKGKGRRGGRERRRR